MHRIRKVLLAPLAAALLAATLIPAATANASAAPASTAKQYTGTFKDGATYLIQVPAHWNGTLFLYSHGYVVPGESNPAQDVGDAATGHWMLTHGYALAGSSYAIAGWAVQYALKDQIATLNKFDSLVGTPTRTVAWGHSLGGMITAGLIQDYPSRFNAALPMCGVVSGGVATWNTALDAEIAFQQLVDPSVQVVNITNPGANFVNAFNAVNAAQKTAAGRARIALGAALADTPGWFTPLSPQPRANDWAAQEKAQFQWDSNVTFPFAFDLRAQLEALAGGNASWDTGVNFTQQLLNSADLKEVVALYQKAGLNLQADLATLNSSTRISADPAAVSYLSKYITYNGNIKIPVLTMHTVGDGLVVNQNEQAYSALVASKGNSDLLRQVFVNRAGHCAFTPAETIQAVRTLINRVNTGSWNAHALSPGEMNTRAAALGPNYNIYPSGSGYAATPPAFLSYQPTEYLRPFPKPKA